ncbi:hypothetical protein VCHA56P521_210026 [Vibrio chagasii]|nr:hypothetical protein VCHA36P168_160045 [Vibrio chagasii]CAH7065950.1 hypothetical protein VCHA52P461_170056 [Vibrio chagasii]CAH7310872.1 hypothetical protein VCHA37P203_210026 [Vibrio chagasii]CAH7328738.1 hypothetical protein VCHA56P521_210026 [Vibrio chagasii]
MSKNYIFRELDCQMTKEEVAELCFKTVRTITDWGEGKPIPPECKRLMRMAKGRELSVSEVQNVIRQYGTADRSSF